MAQIGGNPIKVKLTTDLTKYDERLTVGKTGTTIPNHKCSEWGSQDRFVAVRFDNGPTMDVLYNSIEFIDENYLKEVEKYKQEEKEDLKTARNIEVTYGPMGGFKYLSYRTDRGNFGIGGSEFKKKAEEIIEYFKELKKDINTTFQSKR